ncbi:glycosyltransferase, GT1 family [Aliarcobacter butzleri 7h1h]|uniref:glycosyltransferase family 4 protein n=1 Tax=Aliarcobacter butzleri TaxID=28197 RepID=UPI00035B9FAC|nr:glycosyltransferase family 4 protein [Aliarcobacter butzleri]AGR76985.1 glycosyltransferase, GT1 family [Aliarcobacter butzleri 7h1h]
MNNKKLKVLIFSHQLDRSGAPTSLLNILKSLYEKKYKVDVISARGGELADKYKDVSSSLQILEDNDSPTLFSRFVGFFKLLKMIRKLSPDVILINTSINLRAHLACYILRVPFVVYVRESEDMLKSRLGYFRKKSLKLASKIVSVSNYSSQWVSKYVEPKKIDVIHNGVQINNIKYPLHDNGDTILVGIIGYMSNRKGIDYFAQIINKLMNISDKYKFLIIGDFVDEAEKSIFFDTVKNFINNVSVTGIVENVYPEINKCDIILMTSREESLPRSVMEASLLSKPVVAFDIAGTKEMLPLSYDYLVSPFDIDEFVDKTVHLSEKNQTKKIGEENRKYITQNFSLDITISKIENVLMEVVENAKLK